MNIDTDKIEKYMRNEDIHAEKNVPMSQYTSFRAGGNAAMMVFPRSAEQVREVLRILTENECRHMVIGNGSNILVKDSGYDGVMVRIGSGLDYIEQQGMRLICGSG